jgi:acyl-CoA synthetase (AMP-forming)/AMP-acid ligase II
MPVKIYRSSFPDIKPIDIDLVKFVFSNPNHAPEDRPLYVDAITGTTRTFADVKQRTKSLAHALRQQGVKPKDVVAFFSPNSIDYAITCYGIIGAGATVSPVSAAYTPLELQSQLETSSAKILIAHSSLIDVAEKALKSIPHVQLIQADGDRDKHGNPTAESLAVTSPATDLVSIEPSESNDRLSFMCFSSGTTGRAKGVMTTHRNLVSNLQQWLVHVPEDAGGNAITVTFLPLSHIYGLTTYVCLSILLGNTVVILPRFEPAMYLENIQKYKPEMIVVVPPVMLLLAKHPLVEKYDLSSLRRIMSAAAPLSPELRQEVEQRFKKLYGTTVYGIQAWGMTETSPLGSATALSRIDKRHTVGNITSSMEFRVVNPETMKDVETDSDGTSKQGELWCRGPNVTKGYYRNQEATDNGFARDENGKLWFRTGDIGTIDNEGFLSIVDRIKELIKYKGLQVIPSELEGKLLEHPDIEDACVVSRWAEEQATELPVGFIVVKQSAKARGEKAVIEGVTQWLNAKIANHKRLRGGVYIIEAIPKSPSGKILRRQLKDSLKTKSVGTGSKL